MGKNNNIDIDSLFSSAMAGAEEDVPSHIWDAVSEGLDKRRKALIFRRVSYAFSAVAAAVAAFFILNPKTQDSQQRVETAIPARTSLVADVASVPAASVPAASFTGNEDNTISFSVHDDVQTNRLRETTSAELSSENRDKSSSSPASEQLTPSTDLNNAPSETAPSAADNTVAPNKEKQQDGTSNQYWSSIEPVENKGSSKFISSISLSGNVSGGISQSSVPRRTTFARPDNGGYETKVEQTSRDSEYSMPITIGLGIRIPLARKFSIGTGLTYTYLNRSFRGVYTKSEHGIPFMTVNDDINHSLHYLGIPLNLYYSIINNKKVDFYSYIGAGVEKAIAEHYCIKNGPEQIQFNNPVKGLQYSASVGMGVNISLSDHLGFYFDPALTYWFNCKQPTSIRTQQQLNLTLTMGLRLNL